MPPYIIFSDKTLIQMAMEKPSNKEEMLAVSGVGETNLKSTGNRFLHVLQKDKTSRVKNGKTTGKEEYAYEKENAVIFGVTGVVVAAVLIGGGIYMKTERDRNLNADTASTAADSNRAEEVQKAVFLAEDSGLWYLGDLEHGNIYVTHTPSDTLYDENGNAIDPSEIKKEIFFK